MLLSWHDAFDKRVASAGSASHHDLLVEFGRGGDDVGQPGQLFYERPPVADTVILHAHQLDVRAGGDETILQVAAHAVGDGESDDKRGNSGGDSGDGDGGDHADDGLPPLGFEVTRRHIELKSHLAFFLRAASYFRACLLCCGRAEDGFGHADVVVTVVDAHGDKVFAGFDPDG